jgi:hypothetical protein
MQQDTGRSTENDKQAGRKKGRFADLHWANSMGRKGGYAGEKQIIYRSVRSDGVLVKESIGQVRMRLSSPVQDLATSAERLLRLMKMV